MWIHCLAVWKQQQLIIFKGQGHGIYEENRMLYASSDRKSTDSNVKKCRHCEYWPVEFVV